ncbi:MAG TPA: Nramp family divalent metal transporter [Patescibacteria group bacterium]
MNLEKHKVKDMPSPPSFRKLLGPSFILLGLGLGSGELILWPYLTSNFGMGIIWGAVLGVTLQFFINMEIERYSLVRGESIFVGFARKLRVAPFWFIMSTFVGFGWPGIVGSSAYLISSVLGLNDYRILAIAFLIAMGGILTIGSILYKTVEKISIFILLFSIPLILAITLFISKNSDWISLIQGIVGTGQGYKFLPVNIPIISFLAAFAFSGAGGNLNLAQSFYIKEKGYGMGKFSGRITSILTGEVEEIKLEGTRFEMTIENLKKFKRWWKLVNIEHFLVFWLGGIATILLLGLLAYSSVFGKMLPSQGINFVIFEAYEIAKKTFPFVAPMFLLIAGVLLFSTQMTVLDATSRIMSENLLIIRHESWKTKHLPKIYYSFLWAQIIFGVIVFLGRFGEPLFLLTLSAVINAFAMFVHILFTLFLNLKSLDKEVRPSLIRVLIMLLAFSFFGYLTLKTILSI